MTAGIDDSDDDNGDSWRSPFTDEETGAEIPGAQRDEATHPSSPLLKAEPRRSSQL